LENFQISIVIPTFNEATNIEKLVRDIRAKTYQNQPEIIVADGGSTDQTVAVAQQMGVKVVLSPKAGRAPQMNLGAAQATGSVLYFVHADCQLHPDFVSDIEAALQAGYEAGCYRFRFDSPAFMLKINNFFTRFNLLTFRGGDQTLFITKTLFEELGGFDPHYVIMEDYDIIRKIWAKNRRLFKVVPKDVLVSARKYQTNSWLRVQLANLSAMIAFQQNKSPQQIADAYRKALNYR
jgi:rSAM/selenodomain-associated transferase 2